MSKWEMVRLGDVCKISSGGTPSRSKSEYYKNGYFPWAKISDIEKSNGLLTYTEEKITVAGLQSIRNKVFEKGTLLFAMYGSIGKVCITDIDTSTNQAILGIQIVNNIITKYLYYYFLYIKPRLLNKGNGVALKNLSATIIRELEIPLPSLDYQTKIADILEKAELLISQKKEQIKAMDELIESLFYDMFGDPISNLKDWDITSLLNHGEFKNGLNYSKDDSGVKIFCIGVGDFKSLSKITGIKNLHSLDLNKLPSDDYILNDKDLLFVRSNGNKNLIGRCVEINTENERITYSGFCIRYRLNDISLSSCFLTHLFRVSSFRKAMLKNGRGANIQNINQQLLNNLKIIKPPIFLQNQFADKVHAIEMKKEEMLKGLEELEEMFNSIMQKSFRGELF